MVLHHLVREGVSIFDLGSETLFSDPLMASYRSVTAVLIFVDKWKLSDKGRKFKVYKSRISQADVTIKKPEPKINLHPN